MTNPTNLEITTIHRNSQSQTISQYIQFKWVTDQKRTQHIYMSPRPINDQPNFYTDEQPLYYSATHIRVQWNKAKRTINQVINIMLIYHARQLDLLLLISNSKLTLLQHVTQFHMTLSKNISQTPNFKTRVICHTFTGLQIIFQKLSDMMSGKNKIPLDIYENLLKKKLLCF